MPMRSRERRQLYAVWRAMIKRCTVMSCRRIALKYPENYLDIQQNTPEWLIERIGSVTASRVKDATAVLKSGKESAARASYKLELLSEIITGRAVEHYVSQAMDFGTENEPLARGAYEINQGVEVERIGYIRHPSIPRSGASPTDWWATTGWSS